jgi:hypothetical protein
MVRAAAEHEIADDEDHREREHADGLEHEPVSHDAGVLTVSTA